MKFEAKSVDPSLMPFSDSEIIGDHLIIPVVDYGGREDNSFLVALGKLVETFLRSKSIGGSSIADDVEKMVCEHIGLNWDEHCDWVQRALDEACLLYTSDAADDLTRVDLGGRRIIKKKKTN